MTQISTPNLYTALVAAQKEMRDPVKDGNNPHFKSKFVTLKGVLDAVRPALHKHGIALVQLFKLQEGTMVVETMLAHESGDSVSSYTPIICAKANDPQAFGSAVTYARRYGAAAICGVAPSDEDDDAEQAAPARSEKPKAQPKSGVQPFAVAEEAIAAINSVGNKEALERVGKRIAESRFTGEDLKGVRDAWGERMAIMTEPVS